MRMLWSVLVGVGVVLCGVSAGAQSDKEIRIDIKSQQLVDALNEWAQAAGFRLIGPASATRNLSSPRLQGTFTPKAALDLLLSGTSLTYEFIDDGTVAVRERIPASLPPTNPVAARQVDKISMRLTAAQIDEARSASDHAEAENRPITAENARESDNSKRQRGALEEVVVTAQKRQERLQDVPISIAVLGGVDLDRSTVQGVTEALNRVPGVATVVGNQGGGATLTVRGVTGGFAFAGASPIGYYLDSVPFGFVKSGLAPDSNPYDLERVEVLRGPQGTLYGASAQNGVVRILTKDANLKSFEFKARASVSSTQSGGENYGGDMALNVPIVDGKLAARAVAGYQDLSGWIDKPNAEDVNDGQIRNMRLKVNAQPTEQLSVTASAWLSRADFGAPSQSADGRRQNTPSRFNEPFFADYDVYALRIGYEFPGFAVASSTGYLDYASEGTLDVGPLGRVGSFLFSGFYSKILSQELILNSTDEGAWQWTLGGMYRDGKDRLLQFTPPLINAALPIDLVDKSESYAAFGELTRLFFDGRLGLTAGLRYFGDRVVNEGDVSWVTGQPVGPFIRNSAEFHKLSPRAVVTWRANREMTVYASYAEGFRSGFPQNAHVLFGAPEFPPVQSDNLKNYELGAKGSLWSDRVNFETALYYIDWQDVQQTVTVNLRGVNVTALGNGESASGMGVDFGATVEPLEGLTLGANFSWNDLQMDGDVFVGGRLLFKKGTRLNISPEYTAGASAAYSFQLGSLEGTLSLSGNYVSALNSRGFFNGVSTNFPGDSVLIGRTRFSVEAPEHWTASLFVDNVTNEDPSVRRDARNIPDWDARVRPRTVGVQLEYSW